jgi:hypothetical protein
MVLTEVGMRVEFNQGVPAGCKQWLWDNVGPGNITLTRPGIIDAEDSPEYAWFFERIKKPTTPESFYDDPFYFVPTITVKDPKMAMVFALRWQ